MRYIEHRRFADIQRNISQRYDVEVPIRTLHSIAQRFLLYIIAVHLDSLSLIKSILQEQGTYVLHADATQKKGSRPLVLLKDGLSGIRLWAEFIRSEKKERWLGPLQLMKDSLGTPGATVSDMGAGVFTALKECFPNAHTIICQFHFLRDIGWRLFKTIYPRFRSRIDRTGVKGKLRKLDRELSKRLEMPGYQPTDEEIWALNLIKWILSYTSELEGMGYPFDLAAARFYERCISVKEEVRQKVLEGAKANRLAVLACKIENILRLLGPPPEAKAVIRKEYIALKERERWMHGARAALRYKNGPIPLSTLLTYSDDELEEAKVGVRKFVDEIQNALKMSPTGGYWSSLKRTLRGILNLILENEDHLLAPNIRVPIDGEERTIHLPRTNNTVEQDFRALRRHFRYIQGNSDVEKNVQKYGIGVLLCLNLQHDKYVEVVYGSPSRIGQRFRVVKQASLKEAEQLLHGGDR